MFVAAGASFFETVPGVGVLFPGEAVLTGISATIDDGPRRFLAVAVILAAWSGDQVNYWIARLGTRRLTLADDDSDPAASRSARAFQRALALLRAHGVWTVLIGRLIPFVRSFVPAAAGVARIPPVPFALASAVGCLLWASLWLGAGSALRVVLDWPPPVLAIMVLSAVVSVAVVVLRRRRGKMVG